MKLTINIPDDTHEQLAAHATLDGTSVTDQYLCGLMLYLFFRKQAAENGGIPVLAELTTRGEVSRVWSISHWKP